MTKYQLSLSSIKGGGENTDKRLLWFDSVSGQHVYKLNQYSVKKYTENEYKLTLHKTPIRTAGYELPEDSHRTQCNHNEHKLTHNISRARSKTYEYAICNQWQYFCTFTINGSKYSRDNLKEFYSDFSKWLQNYQRTHGRILYLFVPELHADEVNWHFHGLMNFEKPEVLIPFGNDVPKKLKGYYNWPAYQDKFGFCSFGPVKHRERVAKYILKYINKNLYQAQALALNQNLYYCSKGLNEAQIIKKGDFTTDIVNHRATEIVFDYQNDYVSILNCDRKKLNDILEL